MFSTPSLVQQKLLVSFVNRQHLQSRARGSREQGGKKKTRAKKPAPREGFLTSALETFGAGSFFVVGSVLCPAGYRMLSSLPDLTHQMPAATSSWEDTKCLQVTVQCAPGEDANVPPGGRRIMAPG